MRSTRCWHQPSAAPSRQSHFSQTLPLFPRSATTRCVPPGSETVIITGLRVNSPNGVIPDGAPNDRLPDFGTNLPIWVTRSMIQLAFPRDALVFFNVAPDQVGRLAAVLERPTRYDRVRAGGREPAVERTREGHRLADLEPVLAHGFDPWPAVRIGRPGFRRGRPARMLRRRLRLPAGRYGGCCV